MPSPDSSNAESSREANYEDFVGLLARHDRAIRRFIRSLMFGPEGVDDVAQETALECWRKFAEFKGVDSEHPSQEFVRWACVIARYKVMSWQRDRSRDRLVFREQTLDRLAERALEQLETRQQERDAIERCLAKLPAEQQSLVLSVHAPGESVANIAATTGQKARRLYSRINVLRKRLLDCVKIQLASEGCHG